ncbi:MAG: hypothetical protein IJH87_00905, partial [Atopobiaceae bacterium]|nr:hypothetical protein [Atopobiaceae bacterium]
MASVRERQILAEQLKQVSSDDAFIKQANAFEEQLRALPDVPVFDEESVGIAPSAEVLSTASDCVELALVPSPDRGSMPYGSRTDLIDSYFHDERLPVEPLPQMEDAFDLTDELIARDAVAKVVDRSGSDRARLSQEIPALTAQNEQALSQHKVQVANDLIPVRQRLDEAKREFKQVSGKIGEASMRMENPIIRLLNADSGCAPYIIAMVAIYLCVNFLHLGYILSIGIGVLAFLACIFIPTALSMGVSEREPKLAKLKEDIDGLESIIKSSEIAPAWYTETNGIISSKRDALAVTDGTLAALSPYRWPLTADECGTLAQVTADIAIDAKNWREMSINMIDQAIELAQNRISDISDEIGLMPNAVPDAFTLATIVENGYADDVKEAMLYMATDRYRSSNLALQAEQLNQLELFRMENAENLRRVMLQLFEMSGQLENISNTLDDVSLNVEDMSETLHSMDATLDGIESGVWATAAAAESTAASAAQTARNTAQTARNTQRIANNTRATAYHASRISNATTDLRDFYAEDHPSHNANGDNTRDRR